MFEELIGELGEGAMAQVVVLLIGCIAAVVGGRRRHVGLAALGVVAPVLALAITMVELEHVHARIVEIHELVASDSPLPPRDQRSTALAKLFGYAPVLLGWLIAVIVPITTLIWIRLRLPEPDDRGLRALAVAGAGVVSVALWAASGWAGEFIFERGFINYGCSPHGWSEADLAHESLELRRATTVLAGAALAVAALACAVTWARRGVTPTRRVWLALLALLGVAVAANVGTADERRDARDYFRWQPRGHSGFTYERRYVANELDGPALAHCRVDWDGSDLVTLSADSEPDTDRWLVGDIMWFKHCGEPERVAAILADPAVPMERVALVLETAYAEGRTRFGVATLRAVEVSRATTDEFVRREPCVVEFTLDVRGVAFDRFASWAELVAAVDAADGALVIAPPPAHF